jgi:hypothetical protein
MLLVRSHRSARGAFRLASVAVGLAALLAGNVAAADVTLPVITIHGRPNKPNVTIAIAKPSPAREASAAHDAMKNVVVERTAPPPVTAKTP